MRRMTLFLQCGCLIAILVAQDGSRSNFCSAARIGKVTSFSVSGSDDVSIKHAPLESILEEDTNHDKSSFTDNEIGAKAKLRQQALQMQRGTWMYRFKVWCRALYLLLSYCPIIFTSGFAYVSESFRSTFWFSLLRGTIANSGAAFIKWGQWASTRSDVFPEELCAQLSLLQSDAPLHNFRYTRAQIFQEMGRQLEDVFDAFDPVPLASGSIAQVYKAVYKQQVVAVKVRHPNVEEQIMIDFDIMSAVAAAIESLPGMSWLKLSESMSQFSHTIAAQTDLTVEGQHLEMFLENFKRWPQYDFPHPIVKTPSVLIEHFLMGESVKYLIEDIKKDPTNPLLIEMAHFVVTKGEDLYLKMLLQDNLMHADLHPGNILLHVVPQTKSKGGGRNSNSMPSMSAEGVVASSQQAAVQVNKLNLKISLVDAGMVAKLTASERKNFIGLIEAMGEGNGREAADYVLKFSTINLHFSAAATASVADPDIGAAETLESTMKSNENAERDEAFRRDMEVLFNDLCRGYGTGVDFGAVLRGILHLVREHRVTIEANYATLVMNALCLDGLAKDLLPTYNVLDGAKMLLRLNRRGKKIPFGLSNIAVRTLFPLVQRFKQMSDKVFLNDLRRQPQYPLLTSGK